MKKFLRRDWKRYSRLGKRKKKKQVWRKPKGRHNKMREKKKGYPSVVKIGYKKDKKSRSMVKNKKPVIIKSLKELEKIKENEIIILGSIGKKKKIEIVKEADKRKIEIYNLNIKKFLEKVNKKENKADKNQTIKSLKANEVLKKTSEENLKKSESKLSQSFNQEEKK